MIHPSATVSAKARIGSGVSIGPYSIVHDDVVIGDNTSIGSHCEIGHPTTGGDDGPLVIGRDSVIRSHSVFYCGSVFGERLITGHRVTVREKTRAGQSFQIGTLGDIQGDCEIGDFVRFQSNVSVGQRSRIGNYVWIFPYVALPNDPHPPSEVRLGVTLEDFVAVATMSVILPGVTVKRGALVAAHSRVTRDVDADTIAAGTPARCLGKTSRIKLRDNSGRSAYPWRRHFHRGYPEATVQQWIAEFAGLD